MSRCLILFYLIFSWFSCLSQTKSEIEVSLRMIGHQVLLNAGDSAGRVLPIINQDGTYKIQFESDFELKPNELTDIVKHVVNETSLATNYIVEVEECPTQEVVYSFMINELEQSDIVPCGSRIYPKSCYNLIFSLIPLTEKKPSSSKFFFFVVLAIVPIFLIIIIYKKSKKKTQVINPNLIQLGLYQFDKLNEELIIDDAKSKLTSKESDLLLLLYGSLNTTVERDSILNKVWGDEGDYIGRTLDVFISKLRKKLEQDENIKIVNVRGVGYKLVLNG